MDDNAATSRRQRPQLRVTNTNSGTDSDGGNVSGLSLNNFMLVVVGAVLAIMSLAMMMMMPAFKEMSFFTKILAASVPLFASLGYTMLFFHNKPPGYHGDFYDQLMGGIHFNTQMVRRGQVEHPLMRAARRGEKVKKQIGVLNRS